MLDAKTVLQGRYRIVQEIGQGGMGAVYEAIDERLGRRIALKQTFATTDILRLAFEREARLLANLIHPALPRVLDHFSEGDGQYLVMDYVPGSDLKTLLERQGHPFTVHDVLRWADELLDILEYLHGFDPPVFHRDVKPSNLKLNSNGKIVLLDFGLAKGKGGQVTGATVSRSILAYSPSFSPLEQFQGERTTSATDLYAVAATLYYLLTSKVPPDALTRATCLLNEEPDPLPAIGDLNPRVPYNIGSILTQALNLRPSQRPASASAMRASLKGDDSVDITSVSDSSEEFHQTPLRVSVAFHAPAGVGSNDHDPLPTIAAQHIVNPISDRSEASSGNEMTGKANAPKRNRLILLLGLALTLMAVLAILEFTKSFTGSGGGASRVTNSAPTDSTNSAISKVSLNQSEARPSQAGNLNSSDSENALTTEVRVRVLPILDVRNGHGDKLQGDMIVTLVTSRGRLTKYSREHKFGPIEFAQVPCGETISISINEVDSGGAGTIYKRRIDCKKQLNDLGDLVYKPIS